MERMYDDMKYGFKKATKPSKKKPKPKPKKKRTRKKELTKNERIFYTILLVICIPLGILAFVYYNAGLMETIILAKGLYQTEKNLGLPTDDKTVPYAESVQHGKPTHLSNQENVFDLINKEEKKSASQKGGSKRKYVQKGGHTKFRNSENSAKPFLDTTKFGLPYTWYDNNNFFLNGISKYFITFWIFMRSGLIKLLDLCNESFYNKGYEGHPDSLGGQVLDFAKFTIILPLISLTMNIGNFVLGTGGLFWSSFSEQTIMILPWLIIGILSLVLGTISLIVLVGGLSQLNIIIAIILGLVLAPLCYYWPMGHFWIYLQTMILKITDRKKKLFRNYLKNYELCWILACISMMGISISYLWKWHIIPLVAFGGVGGSFVLLRAMGLI